jgi:peptidoglycan/LPS O-acetylase OafA/YrhL
MPTSPFSRSIEQVEGFAATKLPQSPDALTGSAHPTFHLRYRPDIDGLRAVAVLAVVIFHAFPSSLPGGFVGVDIFFVISGYLIGTILINEFRNGDFSVGRFYARRIKRIFPTLILVIIACYGFGWFNLLDSEFMQLGKHIAAGAGFASNFALWRESGYFDVSAETKPLLHLWSLGVEEQFYLVWPLVLFVCIRARWNVLCVTLVIALASFGFNMVTVGQDSIADFYSPFTRFWELMIGSLLACEHVNRTAHSGVWSEKKSWLGVILLIVALAALRGQDAFPGWRALLPTTAAYLIIDAGCGASLNRRVLASRPMVWVGLVSFPLYLWHWPILAYSRILEGNTPQLGMRFGAVFAALILAWLTYRFVERPIRENSSSRVRNWIVGTLVVLMIGVAFLGYDTYARHGLGFRLTNTVSRFADVQRNVSKVWREHACFLDGEDKFAANCTDTGAGPIVFLWGDSHAAAMYPGLRALQREHGTFRLAQYTASGCPPDLGDAAATPHCEAVQRQVMSFLRRDKPDEVILTASWSTDSLRGVVASVDAIRKSGTTDIVLVGPVPRWPANLPDVYWLYWRKYHRVLPDHTRFGLDPATAGIDAQAQSLAAQLHIRYASAYQVMCNNQGCQTRTGPGKGEITAWDDGHLTPPESLALVHELASTLLADALLTPVSN